MEAHIDLLVGVGCYLASKLRVVGRHDIRRVQELMGHACYCRLVAILHLDALVVGIAVATGLERNGVKLAALQLDGWCDKPVVAIVDAAILI